MAKQLVTKGFPVSCYDIYPPSIEKLVQAGGKATTSPADAARAADMLVVMVVGPGQVSAVLFDKDTGAVHGLRQNAIIIITSTVPSEFYEEVQGRLHGEFGRRDVTLLDCPVSGGTTGAAAGTLTIFSSGPDDGLDKAQPVLKGMGTKLCRIPGGICFGSKAKMCHQVPPEVQIALSNEVMAFAAKAGLNTQATFDAVQASDGWSWVNGNRIPHMLEGDKSVYSAVPNSLKDSVSPPLLIRDSRADEIRPPSRSLSTIHGSWIIQFSSLPPLNKYTRPAFTRAGPRMTIRLSGVYTFPAIPMTQCTK